MSSEAIQPHNYESKFFEAAGMRLHYLHHPNPGKPALLGLHGFKDSARTFTFLEPLLLPNFEVFLMDWNGHGDTSDAVEGYYSGGMLLGALTAFTGEVLPEKYYLMGHSMGAAVGARFAGLMADEILGLVLLEGFSGLVSPETDRERMRSWAQSFRSSQKDKDNKRKNEHKPIKTRRRVKDFLAHAHRHVTPERIDVLADYLVESVGDDKYIWKHDPRLMHKFIPVPFPPRLSRSLWSAIKRPVMILYGAESGLIPSEKAFQEARAETGQSRAPANNSNFAGANEPLQEILSYFKDVEFHMVEDAGHNMHWDQPEVVMEFMAGYFRRLGLDIIPTPAD